MANSKMDDILEYLKTREEQHPPSVREIAGVINMSVDVTFHMLSVLRDRGYITWDPKMARTT